MNRLVQVPFETSLFTELLNGPATYRVEYLQAHVCPNGDSQANHPPQCPKCSGLGYYWESVQASAREVRQRLARGSRFGERLNFIPDQVIDLVTASGVEIPETSYSISADGVISWAEDATPSPSMFETYTIRYQVHAVRALVQSVVSRRKLMDLGDLDISDIQVTVARFCEDQRTLNPVWDAGRFDRIRLLDTWRVHKETVTRGRDRIQYPQAQNLKVYGFAGDDVLPYVEGVDFSFQNGVISWVAGRGPKLKQVYAVEASVSPEYFLFDDLPQTRQPNGQGMPRKFTARLFDRFTNRKGSVQ